MPIKIANAPVSWGIFEFEGITPPYPYEQVLDEIVETGYTGLELGPWGYLPTDPDELRPELEKRHLQLLSSYVPVKLVDKSTHAEGVTQALAVGRLLAALGAKYIVLADDNGRVPALIKQAGRVQGSRLNADQWDDFAAGVNLVAQTVHDELGLNVVFHHHVAGYVETPEETRQLMDRATPDLVGLCLDTGHWHFAGGDALQAVKEYGERVRYLHLKDCDPNIRQHCIDKQLDYFASTEAGVFCELGKGDVDFPAIVAHMETVGYDGWAIVEQDVLSATPEYPKAAARRNREYLREIGL
jgi:inosose dehydratase